MKRLLLLSVVAALVLSACSITGGGYMAGIDGGKATFGFGITCQDNYVVGDWTFHDKSFDPKVNAHGTLTPTSGAWYNVIGLVEDVGALCNDPYYDYFDGDYATFNLMYSAEACTGDCTGRATIVAYDSDQNGKPDKGDWLSVTFINGPYAGYENEGTVMGGNIKVDSPL